MTKAKIATFVDTLWNSAAVVAVPIEAAIADMHAAALAIIDVHSAHHVKFSWYVLVKPVLSYLAAYRAAPAVEIGTEKKTDLTLNGIFGFIKESINSGDHATLSDSTSDSHISCGIMVAILQDDGTYTITIRETVSTAHKGKTQRTLMVPYNQKVPFAPDGSPTLDVYLTPITLAEVKEEFFRRYPLRKGANPEKSDATKAAKALVAEAAKPMSPATEKAVALQVAKLPGGMVVGAAVETHGEQTARELAYSLGNLDFNKFSPSYLEALTTLRNTIAEGFEMLDENASGHESDAEADLVDAQNATKAHWRKVAAAA